MTSTLLRRIHMYLALFLTPWVLMYGLSTMVMNHHQSLRALYGGAPAFSMERELTYERSFDEDAAAGQIAREILIDLDLDGRFRVRGDVSRRLTIIRRDPVSPRRIIYLPKEQRLTVEVQQFRTSNMLAQLHIRRGFQSGYSLDDAWAVCVDLVIGAMLFWVLSGIWLWWEMRTTRGFGALAIITGLGIFGLFLVTI